MKNEVPLKVDTLTTYSNVLDNPTYNFSRKNRPFIICQYKNIVPHHLCLCFMDECTFYIATLHSLKCNTCDICYIMPQSMMTSLHNQKLVVH